MIDVEGAQRTQRTTKNTKCQVGGRKGGRWAKGVKRKGQNPFSPAHFLLYALCNLTVSARRTPHLQFFLKTR